MKIDEGLSQEFEQNLPLLRSEFLKSHPPTSEFFNQWNTWGASWSQSFCPIYLWNDILFVGCSSLEGLSQTLSYSGKSVFVLCETEALSSFFEVSQTLSVSPPASLDFNPESLSLSTIPQAAGGAPSDDPFAGLLEETSQESKNSEDPLNGSEPFELKDSDDSSTENSIENSESNSPAVELMEGLELDISAPSITLAPVAEASSDILTVTPELPVSHETKPAELEAVPTTPEEVIADQSLSNVVQAVRPKNHPLDEFTQRIFKEMKNHYLKSMLFKKQGNALTPWKWDSEFQPQDAQIENPISLGAPSPFRIASRTLKPYHGFLVQNEISEKFFEDWNSSQVPDHLTLHPILDGDQMIGILLGIAEKGVNQKASLALAARLAGEIEESLKKEQQLKAS